MPLTIEAEPFITALRERFALKLTSNDGDATVQDVLAAFDRATVEAVFATHGGTPALALTPQQRGGLTRRQNNAKRKAAAAQEAGRHTEQSRIATGLAEGLPE